MGKGGIKGRLEKDQQSDWDNRSFWREPLRTHTHTQKHGINITKPAEGHVYEPAHENKPIFYRLDVHILGSLSYK